MTNNTILNEIITEISDSIKNKSIGIPQILEIAVQAMELVEQYPSLSGNDKKTLVVQAVTDIVNNISSFSSGTKTTIDTVVSDVLPVVIDFIIAASNGELALNSVCSNGCSPKTATASPPTPRCWGC